MFQFTTFPLTPYVFRCKWLSFPQPGSPIRISTARRICAPYRSFSQLITSFFGSWCQGILPTLFFAWSSDGTASMAVPSEHPSLFHLTFWSDPLSRRRIDFRLILLEKLNWFSFSLNQRDRLLWSDFLWSVFCLFDFSALLCYVSLHNRFAFDMQFSKYNQYHRSCEVTG